MKVVLVTGSRSWRNADTIRAAIETSHKVEPIGLLVEGGAAGADRIARLIARSLGIHVATIEALWDFHGKSAGPKRNVVMVALKPAECLAFPLPESIGTFHCMGKAERAGIPVLNYGVKKGE